MALGISLFYAPNGLITGGVSGLAIVINFYSGKLGFGIPIWLANLALNAPLFLLGARAMSRRFLVRTAFATVFFSLALFAAEFIPKPGITDLVLISIFGGALGGAGMALVLRAHSTTGGTDLAASIVHSRLRHVSVPRLMFVLDGAVIAVGLAAFGPVRAMYAVIAVFITSRVTDAILEGFSFAKAVFVISERPEEIAALVMEDIKRGVTGLHGVGMYTGREKNVLLCVASAKEIVRIKEIVAGVDRSAFVIVADVREVMGEGFISNRTDFGKFS